MPTVPLSRSLPDVTSMRLDAWVDPVIDRLGHDPRSAYVERYWLATLGPSTVWLLRHLVDRLDADGPCTIDLRETAQVLGLGHHERPKQLLRSIDRSCTFGAARFDGHDTLLVRRHLPPLTQRQLAHLPARLQHEHDHWHGARVEHQPDPSQRQRARQLALSLLELGETVDEAERMLHRWRFHPAIAYDALRWAVAQVDVASS